MKVIFFFFYCKSKPDYVTQNTPGFISCVSVSSGICSIKHKSYKKESVSYYSFFFLGGGGGFLLESLTLLLIQ